MTARPTPIPWTDAERQQLRQLWDNGLGAVRIGLLMGRSKHSVGIRSGTASCDGELSLLNAVIRELAAEKMQILAAMRELLNGHDNLYRAHWSGLPDCDPANDIAAKAARRILDEDA